MVPHNHHIYNGSNYRALTLDDIINAKITNALFAAKITSANPLHTNYVFDASGFGATGAGADQNIDGMIEQLIREKLNETKSGSAGESSSEGTSMMDVLRGASAGANGPMGAIGMLGRFIPHIAAGLLAIGFAKKISDFIFGAGGPADLRFKRDMPKEIENYLTRQQQRDTQIGKRQVIIQAQQGFLNLQGKGNSNTMRQIVESVGGNRLSNIGLNERSYGQYWRTS